MQTPKSIFFSFLSSVMFNDYKILRCFWVSGTEKSTKKRKEKTVRIEAT